jgi:hypothetical protein
MSDSPTPADSIGLFDRASTEIVALHRFFVEWYDKATADTADFGLFERAMGPGMQMIPPSGAILDRDAVVHYVRANRGSLDGGFAITIDEIRPAWQADGAIAVTYMERQERAGIKTSRRASAIFIKSSSAPNGVEWRHLHETWMQTVET